MRVAVVYHMIMSRGGAERTTLVMARTFQADIFTTNFDAAQTYPEYGNFAIYTSPLLSLKMPIPFRNVKFGLVSLESIYRFKRMDLSDYDLVITIGTTAKNIGAVPRGRHIHYELQVNEKYPLEVFVKPLTNHLRKLYYIAAQRPDVYLANSKNIREKVKRNYHRDAEVLYPAINVRGFRTGAPGDYFLSIQRIAPMKNIEIQLAAFRKVPQQKLLIVGSSSKTDKWYYNKLVQQAPPNVAFLGSRSDDEIKELYSHARAILQTNLDEDFGRIPVEAMASGKPCIAVNAGGFRESIVHLKTGLLIDPPYAENMAKAIENFGGFTFMEEDCLERSRLFSEEVHMEKIKAIVSKLI